MAFVSKEFVRRTLEDITAHEARRFKLISLRPDTLSDLLAGRARITNMPADAYLTRFGYDVSEDAVLGIVVSRSFEPVPFGDRVPYGEFHVEVSEQPK